MMWEGDYEGQKSKEGAVPLCFNIYIYIYIYIRAISQYATGEPEEIYDKL
jgi:hypothetical protein